MLPKINQPTSNALIFYFINIVGEMNSYTRPQINKNKRYTASEGRGGESIRRWPKIVHDVKEL